MGEEVKADVRWILVVSLILFFWSAWLSLMYSSIYIPHGPWYYLKNVTVLSFIITIALSTLYTTDLWKPESIFEAATLMFIVSMTFFFVSNMQWLSSLLGTTPY